MPLEPILKRSSVIFRLTRYQRSQTTGEKKLVPRVQKLKTENSSDALLLDLDIRRDHEHDAGKIATQETLEIGRTR